MYNMMNHSDSLFGNLLKKVPLEPHTVLVQAGQVLSCDIEKYGSWTPSNGSKYHVAPISGRGRRVVQHRPQQRARRQGVGRQHIKPAVSRIESETGYELDNSVWCCSICYEAQVRNQLAPFLYHVTQLALYLNDVEHELAESAAKSRQPVVKCWYPAQGLRWSDRQVVAHPLRRPTAKNHVHALRRVALQQVDRVETLGHVCRLLQLGQ
ncbi:hypothetical protein BC828DRAFT_429834 [Blastocladiella britannica]|nr:hypothetical protein BC828DRAFT_429834 [Blastocladiella britannica]